LLLACVAAVSCAAGAAEKLTAIVGATVPHPELEGAAVVVPDSTILVAGNRSSPWVLLRTLACPAPRR